MIRDNVVNQLVDAAFDGMTAIAENTTSAEVYSAGLTVAGRTIDAALRMGVDPEAIRAAVILLWEKLPPIDKSQVQ